MSIHTQNKVQPGFVPSVQLRGVGEIGVPAKVIRPATGRTNATARLIQLTLSWWLAASPDRLTTYNTSLVLARLTTSGA